MSEPRYLMGDEAALTEYADELINCNKCKKEFDRIEYRSDTCSECEDKEVKRESERESADTVWAQFQQQERGRERE